MAGLLIIVLCPLMDAECVTRAGCECLQLLRVAVCVDSEHVVMTQQQLHVHVHVVVIGCHFKDSARARMR